MRLLVATEQLLDAGACRRERTRATGSAGNSSMLSSSAARASVNWPVAAWAPQGRSSSTRCSAGGLAEQAQGRGEPARCARRRPLRGFLAGRSQDRDRGAVALARTARRGARALPPERRAPPAPRHFADRRDASRPRRRASKPLCAPSRCNGTSKAGDEAAQRTPASAARWLGAALRLLGEAAPPRTTSSFSALAGAQAATGQFTEAHAALLESMKLLPPNSIAQLCRRQPAPASSSFSVGTRRRTSASRRAASTRRPRFAAGRGADGQSRPRRFLRQEFADSRAWGERALKVARPLGFFH